MSATEAKEKRTVQGLTYCSLFNLHRHRVQVRRPSMVSVVLIATVRRGHCLRNLILKCKCKECLLMRVAQYLKSWNEGTLNLKTSLLTYSGKLLFSTRDCSLRSNKKKALATPRITCSRGVYELRRSPHSL